MASAKRARKSSPGPGPTVFVLFGAAGDLAKRLVLPAFYRLAIEGLLPRQWLLVGNGRGDMADEEFRAHVHDALTACLRLTALRHDHQRRILGDPALSGAESRPAS
jgi:glucose-6-phosphate 1-dehydrogenase